jgi:uncharacterized membrane protein YfcA
MPELFLGWDILIWAVAVVVALIAGVVRGVVGFGYALIMISGLNVVAVPVEVVPLATILDLAGGINMAPKVWRDVHWKGARWLGLGALIGIPLGILLLVSLNPDAMRLGISIAILLSVILIARGFAFRRVPGSPLMFATGGMAGFLSGSGGIPGPPLILLYLSSPLPMVTTRATTVAFFLLVDTVALIGMGSQDLLTTETWLRAAVLAPISFIGIAIGSWLFTVARLEHVKTAALWLLAVLAIVGIVKVLVS